MKKREAQTHFEQAIAIAEADNNTALAQLSRGMLAMLESLNAETRQIRQLIEKAVQQTK